MIFTNPHKLTTNLHELDRRRSGQALLELAIFGSLILFLLGALVSYGLRYNFQQQAQMQAFRKAQELASQLDNSGDPYGSATYALIRDRHIPDPSHPFGVGQVSPVMASASVTRTNLGDQTAADYDGLPKMTIQFQGEVDGQLQESPLVILAAAGFRDETVTMPDAANDYEALQKKYGLVYGGSNVSSWDDYFSPFVWVEDPGGGGGSYVSAGPRDVTIKIIDSVEGEVVDYNNAITQALMIVDQDFCIQECELGQKPGSETSCYSICGQGMVVPWYVEGCQRNGSTYVISDPDSFPGVGNPGDSWHFPGIEALFIFPGKKMGPQPTFTQQVTKDFQMRKEEDDFGITTTDDIYWNTTTNRTILYHDHLNTGPATDPLSGYADPLRQSNMQTQDYSTTRSETGNYTWQTDWE